MPHLIAPRFVGPTQGGPYLIPYSCRFNDDDSARLSRTLAVGNRKTWTFSTWLKLGSLSGNRIIFIGGADDANNAIIYLTANHQLTYIQEDSSSVTDQLTTAQVFRDSSAWYHIVCAVDTTQATESDRLKLYVNGAQVTDFQTENYPAQNSDTDINSASSHVIGSNLAQSASFYGGYLSEVTFVDGAQLDSSSFGEFDDNGVWRPIDVSGLTFGTNGFLLDFADSADLGNDVSGNGNDFTSSGLSTDDRVSDTPTENYATLNVLAQDADIGTSVSNGNLACSFSGAAALLPSTIAFDGTDSFAAKFQVSTAQGIYLGIAEADRDDWPPQEFRGIGTTAGNWVTQQFVGGSQSGGTIVKAPYNDSDVLEFEYNAGTLTVRINGTQYSPTYSSIDTSKKWVFAVGSAGTGAGEWDFGQKGYTPTTPATFKTLTLANLPQPSIKDGNAQFQPTLYTGNGTARNIDQTGNSTFQPDLVWIKNRDQADNHMLVDAVRGATNVVHSDIPDAESTDANGVTSFDADGFGLGTGANGYNDTGEDFVAWQWKANGAGTSNTDGSITSTVSANSASGFSIVGYTGTGSTATVGHGLGVAPQMIIIKNRSVGYGWIVGLESQGWTEFGVFDETSAFSSGTFFNNTAPTSSVFSTGTQANVNASGNDYVAYCFAEIAGYSKIGTYTGNGISDGPFVYTGFEPAFVLIKRTDNTGNWVIYDTARNPHNVTDELLLPNEANAEVTATNDLIDLVANGIKLRGGPGVSAYNISSASYIYIAFAEHPFGGANTTPVTAR